MTTANVPYANNGDRTFTQVTLGSLANDGGLWAGSAWADGDNGHQEKVAVALQHPAFLRVLRGAIGNAERPSPAHVCSIIGGQSDGTGVER